MVTLSNSLFGVAALSACSFHASGVLPPDGSVDASLASGPTISRPLMDQNLAPKRAFVLWQDGQVPEGLGISGYELCSTSGPKADIENAADCPNAFSTMSLYAALEPLTASGTSYAKVRTRFNDGSVSADGELRSFLTDNSLAGWWRLDGNTSDSGGFGRQGALTGAAAFATGFIGQALSLDGTDESMTVSGANEANFGAGDFTLSTWIHPARDGIAEAIITKRSASNGYELFRTSAGRLAFFGAGCGIAISGGSLPMGEWHRVAAVRSGGMVYLYVDQTMAGSAACADNFSNAAVLTFGCGGPDLGCSEPFKGLIDDGSVRNAASDADAVLNDYCADQVAAGVAPLPASCQ